MLYFCIGAAIVISLITLSLVTIIKLIIGAAALFYLIRCAQDA